MIEPIIILISHRVSAKIADSFDPEEVCQEFVIRKRRALEEITGWAVFQVFEFGRAGDIFVNMDLQNAG